MKDCETAQRLKKIVGMVISKADRDSGRKTQDLPQVTEERPVCSPPSTWVGSELDDMSFLQWINMNNKLTPKATVLVWRHMVILSRILSDGSRRS